MKFIKNYWFGTLVGILLLSFVLLFVLILISPKQDMKNRGFVACTQEMIDDLLVCDKKFLCSIKAIASNTVCDVEVVGKGFAAWIKKEQKYPWSNYIFEPELPENPYVNEEERAEYLAEFPNTAEEMMNLKKLNKELENEQNLQNNAEKEFPKE